MTFSASFDLGATLPLLAQHSNWRHMGDRFSGQNANLELHEILMLVGACVGAGVLIWLLRWASRREEDHQVKPNPEKLFRELCRSHGLSRPQKKLLRGLADASHASQPAEVFVRPDLFSDEHTKSRTPAEAQLIAELAEQLFADLGSEVDIDSPRDSAAAKLPPVATPQESDIESGVESLTHY